MSADEPTAVFPDPEGAAHPDRPRIPANVRDAIDHAIRDIKFNFTWDFRDDGAYCYVCAPGGYRINTGSEPQMHEEQRNPDTHKQNLRWWTLQWFKAHGLPIPVWPDCYEDRRGLLWCHVCRHYVGTFCEEDGRRHDATHAGMQWKVMRRNRLTPKGRPKQRVHRHLLDEMIAAREPGYDPDREAAAARGQFGDPAPDPNRPPAIEGAFTARPGDTWRQRMGATYMDNNVPGQDLHFVQIDGVGQQVTSEHLDEWVEEPNGHGGVTRWRRACVYGLCNTWGVKRPCIGQGCECTCHKNADQEVQP